MGDTLDAAQTQLRSLARTRAEAPARPIVSGLDAAQLVAPTFASGTAILDRVTRLGGTVEHTSFVPIIFPAPEG